MNRPEKSVTLKDVAKACGYSANTISRALRGDKKLPDHTRETIAKTAREMGYIRNLTAHTLRIGRSHLVAIIINDINNPYYTNMASEIDRKLSRSGFHMIIFCCHNDESLAENMIQLAISMSVDGILFCPFSNPSHIIQLKNSNTPYVILDRRIEGLSYNSVRLDDESGGYEAAKMLIEHGHRRILYIAGLYVNSSQGDRQRGILRAFGDYGLDASQLRILPWSALPAEKKAGQFFPLLLPLDYTALIAYNDYVAYHCLNDFRMHGVQVPRDISMVSFDHIRRYNSSFPLLNSVTAREETVSEVAVRVLLEQIQHSETENQNIVLPITVHDDGTVVDCPGA